MTKRHKNLRHHNDFSVIQEISAYFNALTQTHNTYIYTHWQTLTRHSLDTHIATNQTTKCREIYSIRIICVCPKSKHSRGGEASSAACESANSYANGTPLPTLLYLLPPLGTRSVAVLTALLHKRKQIIEKLLALGIIVDFIELQEKSKCKLNKKKYKEIYKADMYKYIWYMYTYMYAMQARARQRDRRGHEAT